MTTLLLFVIILSGCYVVFVLLKFGASRNTQILFPTIKLSERTMSAPRVESVHVGTPPPDFNEWTTTKVYYHGFPSLSTERGTPVYSPEFMACGNPWRLKLYPGGLQESRSGWVAIYLCNRSNKSINIGCGFSIKDGKGKQVASRESSTPITLAPMGGPSCDRGFTNFADRSAIIDSLVDGTLVVEVHIKPHEPSKATLPQFIPENPSACKIIPLMFNDEESADIVFAVGEHQSRNNAAKVAKISPVTFYAHGLIIKAVSAVLADLCDSKGDPTTPIEITDVSPEVFRHLLYYIYGGKISNDDMKTHTKDIINAANRYGVATLKLEAEACLVESTTFSLENVMEHLIYADSINCALLKETVMDYILKNKAEVLEKMVSFDDVPSTLMRDLLAAVARGEREEGGADGNNAELKFSTMRISELRRKAHEKGLEVDGSREMLIAALKETP
jgi:hypothetical protein